MWLLKPNGRLKRGLPMRHVSGFDEDSGVYRIVFHGNIEIDEIVMALHGAWAHPKYQAKLLWDFRKATLATLQRREMDRLVAAATQHQASRSTIAKAAILVAHDVDYGVARMLEALSEELPLTISVFRDFDASVHWLGLLSPA